MKVFLPNVKVHTSATGSAASTQVEGCSHPEKTNSERVADCGVTPCSDSSFSFVPGDYRVYWPVFYRHGGRIWKMQSESTPDLDLEVIHLGADDYEELMESGSSHNPPRILSHQESEILPNRPADSDRKTLLRLERYSGESFLTTHSLQETGG
jgi:hypothetical protein